MFETSKDILNLVLALGVLVIVSLIAWLLFMMVSVVRDVRKATKSLRDKLATLDDVLKTLKEKIEKSSSYFTLLVDLVAKLVSHFRQEKRESGYDRPRRRVKLAEDDEE